MGGVVTESDDPWMLQTYMQEGTEYVRAFEKIMEIMSGME